VFSFHLFSSLHLRGSRFGSRTNAFLLGKAEIAAKTRQVFIDLDERTDFSSAEPCFLVVVWRSKRKHPENFQHEFSEARQCVITSRGVKIQRIKREPQQWPLCTRW